MSFVEGWVETDPDGAVITVSQLDNFQRSSKVAIRERLEGDATNNLTGVIETGTFAAAPLPKRGAGRFQLDNIAQLANYPLQDGRGFFSGDAGNSHPKVYSMQSTVGPREIAYLNRDGSRSLLGEFKVDVTASITLGSLVGASVQMTTAVAVITVTDMIGVLVKDPVKGGTSTITNLYGLKVENLTDGVNNFAIWTDAGQIRFGPGGLSNFVVDAAGEVILGRDNLTTGTTTGAVHIQKVAGAPTGAPATPTGHVALVYDSTNNQIYVYNGAWKKTVALT